MDITLFPEWVSKMNRYREQVLAEGQVWRTGIAGHMCAGRDFTVADFTDHGMAAPKALYNLGSLADSSGNGHTLTNGGAVVFDKGINGLAGEAARFSGSATSYLTAPNAVKSPYFSIGFWMKASRIVTFAEMVTWITATDLGCRFGLLSDGRLNVAVSTATGLANYWGTGNSCPTALMDNRWHFTTSTWDGSRIVVFVDGEVETVETIAVGTAPLRGPAYQHASAPLIIGQRLDPASRYPHYGYLDELFITEEVLTLEQHRWLMAAKVPYASPTPPSGVDLVIENHRPNGIFVASDFATQPLVGYNFTGASVATDSYGSLGRTLTSEGNVYVAPDVDGTKDGAVYMIGSSDYLASDIGLPSGTATATLAGWAQMTNLADYCGVIGYGSADMRRIMSNTVDGRTYFDPGGGDGSAQGPIIVDGRWHFLVMVIEDTAFDGVKRKGYVDGNLVSISTTFTGVTLGGAGFLRVGRTPQSAANYLNGAVANAFITNYALTPEEVMKLYAKQGLLLDRGPLDSASFVEGMTDTHLYLLAHTLDPRATLEVRAI